MSVVIASILNYLGLSTTLVPLMIHQDVDVINSGAEGVSDRF